MSEADRVLKARAAAAERAQAEQDERSKQHELQRRAELIVEIGPEVDAVVALLARHNYPGGQQVRCVRKTMFGGYKDDWRAAFKIGTYMRTMYHETSPSPIMILGDGDIYMDGRVVLSEVQSDRLLNVLQSLRRYQVELEALGTTAPSSADWLPPSAG